MIFTGELIYDIILMIQCHFQGKNVNLKGKIPQKGFLENANESKCNTSYK